MPLTEVWKVARQVFNNQPKKTETVVSDAHTYSNTYTYMFTEKSNDMMKKYNLTTTWSLHIYEWVLIGHFRITMGLI